MYIEHFGTLQQQHSETLQTAQEHKTLIGKLETDLSKVQPFLSVRGEGEGQANISSSAEFISGALRDVQGRESVKASSGGANSLLTIVSSQRERFKQRNIELEAVSA